MRPRDVEADGLAATVRAALQHRDDQRAAGATDTELAANLERTIRAAWPKGRDEPWHFLCAACEDIGWRHFVCRVGQRCNGISTRTDEPKQAPGAYKRLCARAPLSDYEHDYVEPCVCGKGDEKRAAVNRAFQARQRGTSEDDAAAMPKKPTRWGR